MGENFSSSRDEWCRVRVKAGVAHSGGARGSSAASSVAGAASAAFEGAEEGVWGAAAAELVGGLVG